jgi:hypothetical protein
MGRINWFIVAGAVAIAVGAIPWLNFPRATEFELLPASLLMSVILAGTVLLPRTIGRAAAVLAVAVVGTCARMSLSMLVSLKSLRCALLSDSVQEHCRESFRAIQVPYDALCYASLVGSVLVVVGGVVELTQLQRQRRAAVTAVPNESDSAAAAG